MENYRALDEVYIRRHDCESLVIRALDNWLDRRRHTPEAYEIVNEILDEVQNHEKRDSNPAVEQETLDYDLYNDSFYSE